MMRELRDLVEKSGARWISTACMPTEMAAHISAQRRSAGKVPSIGPAHLPLSS
jgi:hypothetical protein